MSDIMYPNTFYDICVEIWLDLDTDMVMPLFINTQCHGNSIVLSYIILVMLQSHAFSCRKKTNDTLKSYIYIYYRVAMEIY